MRLIGILSATRQKARAPRRSANQPSAKDGKLAFRQGAGMQACHAASGDFMPPVFGVRTNVFSYEDFNGCRMPAAAARHRATRVTLLLLLTVVLALTTVALNSNQAPLCGRVPDFPCGP